MFDNRGIHLHRASDATITGNTFAATMESGYGVNTSGNALQRVAITNNSIRRSGFAGSAIRLLHQFRQSPHRLVISGIITNDTAGGRITMESVENVNRQ